MMNKKSVLIVLLAMLLAWSVIAAGPEDEDDQPYPQDDEAMLPGEDEIDIMATLDEDGGMTTLVSLLKESGLDSLLVQDGPFTLFAPDDSAFAAMPQEERDALTKDKAALRKLLEHHLVKGSALEFEEVGETIVTALDGASLTVEADYEEVTVDDAVVIDEGIWCRNGIIHVIDRVLKPAKPARKG